MTLARIPSLDDPRLDAYRHLKDTNRTRWLDRFVCEGEKLVRRLLASEFPVESVLVAEKLVEEFAPLVAERAPLYVVPDRSVAELVGFNFHRGVLACGRRSLRAPLESWLATAAGDLTLVVCPDIHDPENLGAMIRVCSGFGVDALLLGAECCDPFSRRVLRVSMGTGLKLRIYQCEDLLSLVARSRLAWGVELLATVLDPAAELLSGASRPARLGLVFGNEGHGLGPDWLAVCQRRVTLPMRGGTDSLNVALAAGIFLYHFCQLCPPG